MFRKLRAAERVDALRVVADDRDVAVAAAHAAKHARLEQVRVLVFVDENVVVQAGDAVGERRRLLEHQRPEEQQIVVVDEIPLRLSARVLGEDADDLARELEELRVLALEDLVDRASRC